MIWWLAESDPEVESSTTEIDPDDPLFSGDPLLAPDDPIDETEIDDALYDQADG